MEDQDVLAERFEARRARLRAVAYQTLGSASEADDAVQEAWLRLSRSDPGNIENLSGWLTTVVARVCLNMLQARREQPAGMHLPESAASDADSTGPEAEALITSARAARTLTRPARTCRGGHAEARSRPAGRNRASPGPPARARHPVPQTGTNQPQAIIGPDIRSRVAGRPDRPALHGPRAPPPCSRCHADRRLRMRPKPRQQSRYVIRLPAILAKLYRIVHR